MTAGKSQYPQGCLDHNGIAESIKLLQKGEPLKVRSAAVFHDLHAGPGSGIQGSLFRNDVAADVGRAGSAHPQRGNHDGIVGIIAAHDLYLSLAQTLYLYQLLHAGHCLLIHHKMGMGVRQLLNGLRHYLDSQAAGIVVDAAGNMHGTHAGIQMGAGRVLVHQHIRRNREYYAVCPLLLTILCKLHTHFRGKG